MVNSAAPTDELLPAAAALGLELGTRTVDYDDRDVILYALAVGARATELDLVFERRLTPLPTFVLPLGLWACDELGSRGFFSTATAVQGAQRLERTGPIPVSGPVELSARVSAVWDKGSAAIFDVAVTGPGWTATYSVFAPGAGGWGGERGPAAPHAPAARASRRLVAETSREQAALYRLTGDRHLIHIDPDAARAIGQPRPILHGLCTLGIAARELAGLLGVEPPRLTGLAGRFAAPVLPGDRLEIRAWEPDADGTTRFAVAVEERTVVDGGWVRFS